LAFHTPYEELYSLVYTLYVQLEIFVCIFNSSDGRLQKGLEKTFRWSWKVLEFFVSKSVVTLHCWVEKICSVRSRIWWTGLALVMQRHIYSHEQNCVRLHDIVHAAWCCNGRILFVGLTPGQVTVRWLLLRWVTVYVCGKPSQPFIPMW